MIARNLMIVVALTTLVASSGCCNMKDLFFGRGARCGLSNPLGGGLGNCGIGSCGLNPFKKNVPPATCPQPAYVQPAPAYAPAYQAPAYQPAPVYQSSPVVSAPPCQCESYGTAMGEYASCNDGYAMSHSGCGCGAVSNGGISNGYGPVVSDPYASSGIVYENGGYVTGENIISDLPIGASSGGTIGSGIPTLPSVGDSFGPRSQFETQRPSLGSHMTDQYDRDGHRIIDRQPVN